MECGEDRARPAQRWQQRLDDVEDEDCDRAPDLDAIGATQTGNDEQYQGDESHHRVADLAVRREVAVPAQLRHGGAGEERLEQDAEREDSGDPRMEPSRIRTDHEDLPPPALHRRDRSGAIGAESSSTIGRGPNHSMAQSVGGSSSSRPIPGPSCRPKRGSRH